MTAPRFALPGSWARIDLSTEATIRRSIRRLTETVTGRRDEFATTRAELRARFLKAAELAREGGASDMFVGLELLPDVPLPAWLTVFEADIDATDLRAIGFDDLARVLETSVGPAPEGGTTRAESVDARTPIHAIRQTYRRTTHVSEGDVERDFDLIEADYWIAAENPSRLAMMTFSTALAEYEEEMLDLFDAVISTIRWEAPAPESETE